MSKQLKLSEYIEMKGASEVARELSVEPQTVLYWKALRSAPKPHTAKRLIELTNGLITWQSIYEPYVLHNNEKQLEFDFQD